MSNPGLNNLLARCHASLKRAGLADGGTVAGSGALLRRKDGSEVPCRVFVTLNAQRIGADGGVFVVPAEIVVLREDIGAALPTKGEAFVVGSTQYRVEAPLAGGVTEADVAVHCMPGVVA
jgi:hypothetical protein